MKKTILGLCCSTKSLKNLTSHTNPNYTVYFKSRVLSVFPSSSGASTQFHIETPSLTIVDWDGGSGGYLPGREAARYKISATFTDTKVNNCFSIYHTSWITSGPKSNFICDNTLTKAILFFFGCSEVNSTQSTWLITSELANQRARKVLFTCVVYSNVYYHGFH